MTYPYYTAAAPQPLPIPLESPYDRSIRPELYLPDENLQEAVNLAILLGQPLLLTGEAGTGKTQLAYHLAHQLQLGEPLKFETKSNSAARDLFYIYDHLRHFQAAQTKQGSNEPRDYVHYHALGLAILRTLPRADIGELVTANFPDAAPCRSVVLIDEIDKAPRDFPNDLLNEVEGLYFRIPELGNRKVTADPALRPLLVLTSNSEKHLPAAFLRRCVYYHLPFPDAERLMKVKLPPAKLEAYWVSPSKGPLNREPPKAATALVSFGHTAHPLPLGCGCTFLPSLHQVLPSRQNIP